MRSSTPKRPSRRQLDDVVENFNRIYPVGTQVILKLDSGREVCTPVAHKALVLNGQSAVAWFEGVSGCYSIENDRVRAVVAETAS